MDSYYQDHQGNEMGEGSRYDSLWNASTWLSDDGYSPSDGHPQQNNYSSSAHKSDYSQGDQHVACNPYPTDFSSNYGEQAHNSFEATVIQRLDAIQAQMDRVALGNEEIGLRCRNTLQSDVVVMGTILRTRIEEEFRAYEERSIKRLEEHYEKIEPMLKMLDSRLRSLEDKIESLHWNSQTLDRRMDKLEQRMGQLCFEVYKTQGKIVVSESDDDCIECLYFDKELPGYVGESLKDDARNDNSDKSAMKCEPTSLASSAYKENERIRCDVITSSRSGGLADEAVQKHSMNIDGMREGNNMACSPVEQRNHSNGAELPSLQEESSLPPTIRTWYSCEIACAPQVQASVGALASSTSRDKSHGESSRTKLEPAVDFEEQQRKSTEKRRGGAQVWIPRDTLEAMGIFLMTELSLGDKSCVPYRAKPRKRRQKSSNPPGGIG